MIELLSKYGIVPLGKSTNIFTFKEKPYDVCLFYISSEKDIKQYSWGIKIKGKNWIVDVFNSGNIMFNLL